MLLSDAAGDKRVKVWSVPDGALDTTLGEDPSTGHKLVRLWLETMAIPTEHGEGTVYAWLILF